MLIKNQTEITLQLPQVNNNEFITNLTFYVRRFGFLLNNIEDGVITWIDFANIINASHCVTNFQAQAAIDAFNLCANKPLTGEVLNLPLPQLKPRKKKFN